MYWTGDGNWGAWVAMTASMVIFWGVIAWVAIAAFRRPIAVHTPPTPEEILSERFARGEIDEAEFHRRHESLSATRPTPGKATPS